jgi:hypothetical protein
MVELLWAKITGINCPEALNTKQGANLQKIGQSFADEWYPILTSNGLAMEWPVEYLEGRDGLVCQSGARRIVAQDDDDVQDVDDDE